jgi:hypothetical protein
MTFCLAIDWDDTWTRDPALFAGIAAAATAAGWLVIICTNRAITNPIPVPAGMRCVYANGFPKRDACHAAGIHVHVWIDDLPVLVNFGMAGLDKLRAQGIYD